MVAPIERPKNNPWDFHPISVLYRCVAPVTGCAALRSVDAKKDRPSRRSKTILTARDKAPADLVEIGRLPRVTAPSYTRRLAFSLIEALQGCDRRRAR